MRRVFLALALAAVTMAQGPLPSPVAGGTGGGGGTGCVPSGAAGDVLSDSGTGACVSNTTAAGALTFIATPSSANLRALITDESGTGAALFANGAIGNATATTVNKVTLTQPATGSTLTIADGKTLTDTSAVGAVPLKGATGGGFAASAAADIYGLWSGCGANLFLGGTGACAASFTLTTTGSSGAATFSAGTLNIPQYSGGGSANSVFTGSTGCTVTSGATPAFSLADVSVKSPIICNFVPTVSVTAPTITNKSAGAHFFIRVTTDGTHTWSWNSIVSDNVCPIYTASAQTTIASLIVDPDGSTVHGDGCVTGMAGLISYGATASTPTDTIAASNMLCVLTTAGIDCLDPSAVHHVTVVPDAGAANNFLTAISAGGVPSKARPTCSTLSDSVSTCNSLASPAFTGTPTAPTPSAGDNSTTLPTTAFVTTAIANAVAAANPATSVLAASTSSQTGTYSNGVSGVGATFTITATGAYTLDGTSISTIGQRVLLKDQSSAFQNGIYTATVVGTVAVSPVFTRALDYDQSSDINNTGAVFVQTGTANILTSWLLTSTVMTVGTDALNYSQSSSNPSNLVTQASNGTSGGVPCYTSANKALVSSAALTANVYVVGGGAGACPVALSPTFSTQTDAATVTWAIASAVVANAGLTFTVHSGSRTLNITNPANGGSYVLWIKQDGTGGEGLTLGTGCTWKVSGGGAGAVTPSVAANAIDVLAFTYDGTNCYANFNKNFN